MPNPIDEPVLSDTARLRDLFAGYLLRETRAHAAQTPLSRELISAVVYHKSFLATFSHYEHVRPADISDAIERLIDDIWAYFDGDAPFGSQAAFDAWHYRIGDTFLNACAGFREFNYGKAQKMINVTLKHLSCYDVSPDFFTYGHMILDSMTYTGYRYSALDGGFYKYEVDHDCTPVPWSSLSYGVYIRIQNRIREYLAGDAHEYIDALTQIPLTPFQAEFYVWRRYKR